MRSRVVGAPPISPRRPCNRPSLPPTPLRLASVASVLQQSGSLDEMLESEEHLSDQLESLPYLCRRGSFGGFEVHASIVWVGQPRAGAHGTSPRPRAPHTHTRMPPSPLPPLPRFQYDKSSAYISGLMDPLVAQYEEVGGGRSLGRAGGLGRPGGGGAARHGCWAAASVGGRRSEAQDRPPRPESEGL